MRPMRVVVVDVDAKDTFKLSAAADQEPVEAVAARAHESPPIPRVDPAADRRRSTASAQAADANPAACLDGRRTIGSLGRAAGWPQQGRRGRSRRAADGATWRRSTASSWRSTTISSSLNSRERKRSAATASARRNSRYSNDTTKKQPPPPESEDADSTAATQLRDARRTTGWICAPDTPTSAEVKRTVGTAATGFDEQCIVGRRPPIQRWRGCRRAPGAHAR